MEHQTKFGWRCKGKVETIKVGSLLFPLFFPSPTKFGLVFHFGILFLYSSS